MTHPGAQSSQSKKYTFVVHLFTAFAALAPGNVDEARACDCKRCASAKGFVAQPSSHMLVLLAACWILLRIQATLTWSRLRDQARLTCFSTMRTMSFPPALPSTALGCCCSISVVFYLVSERYALCGTGNEWYASRHTHMKDASGREVQPQKRKKSQFKDQRHKFKKQSCALRARLWIE